MTNINDSIDNLFNEVVRWKILNARGTHYAPETIEMYKSRLIELIVKECIEVCNSRVGNSDYNTGRMHCVSDIKERFGVD